MTHPQRNTELLEKTMQHILDHPEEHDQSVWVCDTAACFAGRTALMAGWTVMPGYVITPGARVSKLRNDGEIVRATGTVAREILGLTSAEADCLFDGGNTVPMLQLMVKDLVNGDRLQEPIYYRQRADAVIARRLAAS